MLEIMTPVVFVISRAIGWPAAGILESRILSGLYAGLRPSGPRNVSPPEKVRNRGLVASETKKVGAAPRREPVTRPAGEESTVPRESRQLGKHRRSPSPGISANSAARR